MSFVYFDPTMHKCNSCNWWHMNLDARRNCNERRELKRLQYLQEIQKSTPTHVHVSPPQRSQTRVQPERIVTPFVPLERTIPTHFRDDLARMSELLNWSCVVCLETMDEKRFNLTPCFHKLCIACENMLRTKKNPRCPICRESLE